jgi:hypothetical protein
MYCQLHTAIQLWDVLSAAHCHTSVRCTFSCTLPYRCTLYCQLPTAIQLYDVLSAAHCHTAVRCTVSCTLPYSCTMYCQLHTAIQLSIAPLNSNQYIQYNELLLSTTSGTVLHSDSSQWHSVITPCKLTDRTGQLGYSRLIPTADSHHHYVQEVRSNTQLQCNQITDCLHCKVLPLAIPVSD